MKRIIKAADESDKNEILDKSEQLKTAVDSVEDDFNYLIAGIEKLGREGSQGISKALSILKEFNSNLQIVIQNVAEDIGE